jgi:hypothetical protein
MTPTRWKYLKALQPSPGRMVWRSTSDVFNAAGRGTFCENRSARKQANREAVQRETRS